MRTALPSFQSFRPALALVTALGAAASPSAFAADYATVISSTPVTAPVAVARQVCRQERQYVQQAPSGAGALIGAIAGGVIGNSIGNGFGRAAATGIGAVAGSAIGNQVEADSNPVSEVPVQRCQQVSRYENRTVGYDVMYEYAGQRYSTRMARDPGQRFAVSVQPADGASNALPVPAYDSAAPPAYYDPQPAYYEPLPRPVYYTAPPMFYPAPVIGFGIGYYGGYHGRHWR
jgi:uncharacterized protein YcfJ